uniref:Uncharacterized protein n=1 Tax=Aegilops tauschii TaxID=37682 RepID=R7WF11_AEGTA
MVTFVKVAKTMEQGAVSAVTKWQTLAPAVFDDLSIRVVVQNHEANFQGLYLRNSSTVVVMMWSRFPELGQAAGGVPRQPVHDPGLLRQDKSDYVNKQLTKETWEKIFLWPNGTATGQLVPEPHGGIMGCIAADDIPFPQRISVLYNIQYVEFWKGTVDGGDIGLGACTTSGHRS